MTNIGGTSATSSADLFTYIPAPTVVSLSPAQGPASGGTTVTINGSGFTSNATVQFGNTPATSVTFTSSTQLQAVSPSGSGTVDVTVTNIGGTSATSSVDLFTYIPAPTISSVSPYQGPTNGGTAVTINGSGFTSNATVQFGNTPATSVTFTSSTQLQAVAPSGSGTVDVTVTNIGGTSATSSADLFTYVPAPTISSVSPYQGPTNGGTAVTINGSGFTSNATVQFGNTPATSVTFTSSTQLQAVSPSGSGTVDVTVTNIGGTSATSSADLFTYVPAPTISSVSPYQGPTNGGTAVTINGSGFTSNATVQFGNTPATSVTFTSSTQLQAVAPSGSGTVDVTVTNIGGTSATSSADLFTYIPAPTISSVSPYQGPTNGGTAVTINGSGFTSNATVQFGNTPATSVTFTSSTQLQAVAPSGSGTVDVTVTNIGGTSATSSADLFTYIPAPTISSVSPYQGPTNGGTAVTINGSGFTSNATVQFGNTPATSVTFTSSTQLQAVSPSGSGTVDVTVTNIGGTSATSSADLFTYIPAPTISSVSPYQGPTNGGTAVTINGSGFTSNATVQFGNTPATSVTFTSSKQLQAVSPSGSGTVDVTVITTDGISKTSSDDQFTYIPLPPRHFKGSQKTRIVNIELDYVNTLTWKHPSYGSSSIVAYKIFRNKQLSQLLATVSNQETLIFEDHNLKPGRAYSYYIVSVDQFDNISAPVKIKVWPFPIRIEKDILAMLPQILSKHHD